MHKEAERGRDLGGYSAVWSHRGECSMVSGQKGFPAQVAVYACTAFRRYRAAQVIPSVEWVHSRYCSLD